LNRIINRMNKNLIKQADADNIPVGDSIFNNSSNNNNNEEVDQQTVYEINQLLDKVKNSANSLKDIYYALFDQLNGLYQSYPSIYKQLQMTVKLPTNQDAMNIVSFSNSLNQSLDKFKDPIYLKSYISNSSETL